MQTNIKTQCFKNRFEPIGLIGDENSSITTSFMSILDRTEPDDFSKTVFNRYDKTNKKMFELVIRLG